MELMAKVAYRLYESHGIVVEFFLDLAEAMINGTVTIF